MEPSSVFVYQHRRSAAMSIHLSLNYFVHLKGLLDTANSSSTETTTLADTVGGLLVTVTTSEIVTQ